MFKLAYFDANGKWNVMKVEGVCLGNELKIELPPKIKLSSKFILIE